MKRTGKDRITKRISKELGIAYQTAAQLKQRYLTPSLKLEIGRMRAIIQGISYTDMATKMIIAKHRKAINR